MDVKVRIIDWDTASQRYVLTPLGEQGVQLLENHQVLEHLLDTFGSSQACRPEAQAGAASTQSAEQRVAIWSVLRDHPGYESATASFMRQLWGELQYHAWAQIAVVAGIMTQCNLIGSRKVNTEEPQRRRRRLEGVLQRCPGICQRLLAGLEQWAALLQAPLALLGQYKNVGRLPGSDGCRPALRALDALRDSVREAVGQISTVLGEGIQKGMGCELRRCWLQSAMMHSELTARILGCKHLSASCSFLDQLCQRSPSSNAAQGNADVAAADAARGRLAVAAGAEGAAPRPGSPSFQAVRATTRMKLLAASAAAMKLPRILRTRCLSPRELFAAYAQLRAREVAEQMESQHQQLQQQKPPVAAATSSANQEQQLNPPQQQQQEHRPAAAATASPSHAKEPSPAPRRGSEAAAGAGTPQALSREDGEASASSEPSPAPGPGHARSPPRQCWGDPTSAFATAAAAEPDPPQTPPPAPPSTDPRPPQQQVSAATASSASPAAQQDCTPEPSPVQQSPPAAAASAPGPGGDQEQGGLPGRQHSTRLSAHQRREAQLCLLEVSQMSEVVRSFLGADMLSRAEQQLGPSFNQTWHVGRPVFAHPHCLCSHGSAAVDDASTSGSPISSAEAPLRFLGNHALLLLAPAPCILPAPGAVSRRRRNSLSCFENELSAARGSACGWGGGGELPAREASAGHSGETTTALNQATLIKVHKMTALVHFCYSLLLQAIKARMPDYGMKGLLTWQLVEPKYTTSFPCLTHRRAAAAPTAEALPATAQAQPAASTVGSEAADTELRVERRAGSVATGLRLPPILPRTPADAVRYRRLPSQLTDLDLSDVPQASSQSVPGYCDAWRAKPSFSVRGSPGLQARQGRELLLPREPSRSGAAAAVSRMVSSGLASSRAGGSDCEVVWATPVVVLGELEFDLENLRRRTSWWRHRAGSAGALRAGRAAPERWDLRKLVEMMFLSWNRGAREIMRLMEQDRVLDSRHRQPSREQGEQVAAQAGGGPQGGGVAAVLIAVMARLEREIVTGRAELRSRVLPAQASKVRMMTQHLVNALVQVVANRLTSIPALYPEALSLQQLFAVHSDLLGLLDALQSLICTFQDCIKHCRPPWRVDYSCPTMPVTRHRRRSSKMAMPSGTASCSSTSAVAAIMPAPPAGCARALQRFCCSIAGTGIGDGAGDGGGAHGLPCRRRAGRPQSRRWVQLVCERTYVMSSAASSSQPGQTDSWQGREAQQLRQLQSTQTALHRQLTMLTEFLKKELDCIIAAALLEHPISRWPVCATATEPSSTMRMIGQQLLQPMHESLQGLDPRSRAMLLAHAGRTALEKEMLGITARCRRTRGRYRAQLGEQLLADLQHIKAVCAKATEGSENREAPPGKGQRVNWLAGGRCAYDRTVRRAVLVAQLLATSVRELRRDPSVFQDLPESYSWCRMR